jgi:hypothetical protein
LIPRVGDAVPLLDEDVDVMGPLDVEDVETTPDVLDVPAVVEVPTVPVELDFMLEVDEATLTLLLERTDASPYISSLLPAPQYSYGEPGQMKLQSP